MTQYNSINIKLSDSQLNKLKLSTENKTEVTLKDYHQIWLLHNLLLTDRPVAIICKGFENDLSSDINLSKVQLSKWYN